MAFIFSCVFLINSVIPSEAICTVGSQWKHKAFLTRCGIIIAGQVHPLTNYLWQGAGLASRRLYGHVTDYYCIPACMPGVSAQCKAWTLDWTHGTSIRTVKPRPFSTGTVYTTCVPCTFTILSSWPCPLIIARVCMYVPVRTHMDCITVKEKYKKH